MLHLHGHIGAFIRGKIRRKLSRINSTVLRKFSWDASYLRTALNTCSSIRRVLAKSRLNVRFIRDSLRLILGRVLCETRLIFPRINGPIMCFFHRFRKLDQGSHTISNRRFKDLQGLSRIGDLDCAKTLKKERLELRKHL